MGKQTAMGRESLSWTLHGYFVGDTNDIKSQAVYQFIVEMSVRLEGTCMV
jgi:hypothetical protein